MAASLRPGTTALSVAQNFVINRSKNCMKYNSSINRIHMKKISYLCLREKEGISSLRRNGNYPTKNIKEITPDYRCSIYAYHSLYYRLFYSSTFYHAIQNTEPNMQKSNENSDNTGSQPDVVIKQIFSPGT